MSAITEQSGAQAPECAADALALVEAGLRFLASADATGLTVAEQAGALRALGRAESMHLAATCRVLAAFDAGGGYELDCHQTARSWLRWKTQVSSAAAGWTTAWVRRLAAHPQVAAALAAGRVSPSYARGICELADRLPADRREEGERILLAAAAEGSDLSDLAVLTEEMLRRAGLPDTDGSDDIGRRRLRLTRHFRGWGRLEGDLTPAAAQALQAVLEAQAVRTGPEDERTAEQRDHDALEEVCRQVVAAGLPDRAGQPTQIQLHMSLSQLLGLPGADAAAGQGPAAPPGADCDASIVPVVTGHVDADVLAELAARLTGRPGGISTADLSTTTGHASRGAGTGARIGADATVGPDRDAAGMASRAAAQIIIRDAVRLLSGPGGLAGYLRTGLLTGPAASISLPLDVGKPTETVPAHLRRAVIIRDQHCTFPGCRRRAAHCQVHHLVPRSEGGPTSLGNCALLCSFHHLIAIHTWGWQLALNPDGTTVATSPDGSKTLRSHAPPTAA